MFLLNRGEIKDILDANYFVAINDLTYKKLLSSKVPLRRLREISSLVTKGESPLWQGNEFQESGIPFIRGKNIKHGNIVFDNIVYIDEETHRKLKRSILNEDLLLLTMAGTLGDVAIFKKEFPESNINQDIAKIRLLTNKISYNYANVFFQTDLAKVQVDILSNGGTRGHLNFDKIRAFQIPVSSLERQKEIVEFYDKVKAEKKAKEDEARKKLASVDDLVLDALGITLPEQEENTLERRIFFTKSSDVSSGRFDPLYFASNLFGFLKQTPFETKTLRNFIRYMFSGFAAGKGEQSFDEEVIQIRPTNINENRQLTFHKNIYIKKEELEKHPTDILKRGEVLFNNTNSQELVGKSVYFDVEGDFFCSNHITRIATFEESLNPKFLTLILNLYQRRKIFYSICTNWNNQSGVNVELLKTLKIPIPPPEVQTEIAERVEAIYAEAKLLREQGAEILKQAKAEVEKMILGETL